MACELGTGKRVRTKPEATFELLSWPFSTSLTLPRRQTRFFATLHKARIRRLSRRASRD